MRKARSLFASTALLATACVVAIPGAAHADSSCDEIGTYYCVEVGTPGGTIEFATYLGSDNHEYADVRGWSSADHFEVYLDRSSDGGQTWDGWIAPVGNAYGTHETEWTGDLYDGPPYVSRGCINVNGISWCTAWH